MPSPPQATLFYDGGCPLCAKEIDHYRRLDSERRVSWLDIHATPAHLEPHGVAPADALARIHAVDRDGKMQAPRRAPNPCPRRRSSRQTASRALVPLQVGVPAFLAVWSALPYWWVLPPIMRAVPMGVPIASAAYTAWARHRLRITGRPRELGEGSACTRSKA